jgi:hypothetical protein
MTDTDKVKQEVEAKLVVSERAMNEISINLKKQLEENEKLRKLIEDNPQADAEGLKKSVDEKNNELDMMKR